MEPSSKKITSWATRLQKNDRRAAERLFDYFAPRFFSFFCARSGDRHAAEDLVQDVFMKVLAKIGDYNPDRGDFSPWIWQIARNTLIDFFREKGRAPKVALGAEEQLETAAAESDPDRELQAKQIFRLVETFPEDEQEIFYLRFVADLPYGEISAVTGKSPGALRVMIHRINRKIAAIIS